jgi:AraC-like DNA-binding protein
MSAALSAAMDRLLDSSLLEFRFEPIEDEPDNQSVYVLVHGKLDPNELSEIENSILFLAESGKSFGTYGNDIIESRLCEIVYIIADAITDSKSQSSDGYDGRIFRAKKYIEDNPSSFFTCGELAALCHLSEKQMTRLFYKYEGKSLLAYIHEQKLKVAKELLGESDATQESIALALGFSSVHYFNKFFLRHAGKSPGEFRKGKK